MTDTFQRLRALLVELDRKAEERDLDFDPKILASRTERIARAPLRAEVSAAAMTCMLFERSGRRYAVRIDALDDVGPIGSIARVPGAPDVYLGVCARRGKIVGIVDLPRLFGANEASEPPRWLVVAAHPEVVCGVAADELHDIIQLEQSALGRVLPTFPRLVQKHALGVLEDRTLVLNLGDLLSDAALRVDERIA
jgi:purine-binding chemotaxis protein CheW